MVMHHNLGPQPKRPARKHCLGSIAMNYWRRSAPLESDGGSRMMIGRLAKEVPSRGDSGKDSPMLKSIIRNRWEGASILAREE